MSRRRGQERAARQARSVGTSVRLARATTGMSARAAADRAGMARSTWDRIEAGNPAVTFANLVAATDAVGLDLVCQTYAGREPGLRDSGQLSIAQRIITEAGDPWRASLEVRAGEHGEAVDLALFGPTEIIAVEIERLMVDAQGQLRRATIKRDWLAAQHSRPVRLVIVVADTQRNRSVLTPFLPTLRTTFPAGTREVMRAVRGGEPLGADGLAWIRQPPNP